MALNRLPNPRHRVPKLRRCHRIAPTIRKRKLRRVHNIPHLLSLLVRDTCERCVQDSIGIVDEGLFIDFRKQSPIDEVLVWQMRETCNGPTETLMTRTLALASKTRSYP